jgi:predicted nucleotidyltransferase
MFGLTEQEYRLVDKAIQALINQGAKIWCFGSRARGDHRKYSDLDLMVECEKDLTREIAAIQEELEESNLPIKVDLVQEKDFAESYRESYLRDRKNFDSSRFIIDLK